VSRKRKHSRNSSPFAALEKRARELLPDLEIRTNPPHVKKLSEALEELVAPLAEGADSVHAYRNLIGMGVLVWNADALGQEGAQILFKLRAELTKGQDPEDRQAINEALDTLHVRKRQLFPHDKRVVVDFEVLDTGAGYQLQVASLQPG
jgi:hypothetical protein